MKHGLTRAVVFLAGVACGTQLGYGQGAETLAGRKLTHIAVIVPDVEKAVQMYSDLWNLDLPKPSGNVATVPMPPNAEGLREVRVKGGGRIVVDGLRIDLHEPIGPGPWMDHLQKFGPSVHHVGFEVAELQPSIRLLEQKGGRLEMAGVSGAYYAHVNMKSLLGFNIELVGPRK